MPRPRPKMESPTTEIPSLPLTVEMSSAGRPTVSPDARKLWTYLTKELKVPAAKLPGLLSNPVIARSRKDKLGRLEVKAMTGLVLSRAQRVMSRFEKNLKGREELVEKLEAAGDKVPEDIREKLLPLLRAPENNNVSLPRLIAETGVSAMAVMRGYADGAALLHSAEATIDAFRNLPELVKDLGRHAIDKEIFCEICLGSGMTKRLQGQVADTIPCVACSGTGRVQVSSPHKEFAAKTLLEITKTLRGPNAAPEVNVNVGVGVKLDGKSPQFFERMVKLGDSAVYGGGFAAPIDVTPVRPEA